MSCPAHAARRDGFRSMELRQLRYFCKVAEHRSFTAAAEALNVSQPTLGVQIKNLEEELALQLFRRHSRGVELTEAGSIYFSQIQDVLRRLKIAEQSVDHLRTAPRQALRIGVIPSIGIAVMSTVLEAAESLVPDLEISILVEFTENLSLALIAGEIDCALSFAPIQDERFESTPLYLDRMRLIGSQALFGDLPDTVSFEVAASLPLALDKYSVAPRAAKELGIPLTKSLQIRSMMLRQELVANGQRGFIGPYLFMHKQIENGELRCHDIEEPSIWCQLYLNSKRVQTVSETERRVFGLIRQHIDRLIQSGEYRWLPPNAEAFSASRDIGEAYMLY